MKILTTTKEMIIIMIIMTMVMMMTMVLKMKVKMKMMIIIIIMILLMMIIKRIIKLKTFLNGEKDEEAVDDTYVYDELNSLD